MTKLLVGLAVFMTFLIGLVMMVSVGLLGGSAASPTAQQEMRYHLKLWIGLPHESAAYLPA